MPKTKLNKNPGFVTELKAKFKERFERERQQAEATYKKMVEIPGSSSQEMASTSQTQPSDLVYAELAFSETFRKKPKPVEDSIEYAEILFTGYIEQSKELLKLAEDIKGTDRKIAGIGKLKELNQSESNLALIEEELKKNHDSKLNLQAKLLEIRVSLNKEFDLNFERLQKKETGLEEGIENTHGIVDKYNQLKAELYNTRNEHIRLIQKRLKFEQAVHQISQEDLKMEIEKELFTFYQAELGLQYKIQKDLSDEKVVIEQNLQLHAKETPEFKQYSEKRIETVNQLVSCQNRILILENEIKIKEKAFQNEEVEFIEIGALGKIDFPSVLEANPFFEQEQALQIQGGTNLQGSVVDQSVKLSRLAQSHFFSTPAPSSFLSSDQAEKEKEKISKKGFASRQ